MNSGLKTIAWHQLDGESLVRANEHWFRGANHRVVGETTHCWVYEGGWVRGDGPRGTWISDDLSSLCEFARELLALDVWDKEERAELLRSNDLTEEEVA